ncbi:hypothetical protein ACOZ32_01115 (plasmid) [Halobacterium sp. MBLA0001]|uniref:YidE family protein n=4 Tax=Halobacterium salinarum TaxID=2242 RepID=O52005_HALSA|nr:hypothetical protein [Halobacterium salinarum]AAC82885.1 unknown [Halobacterium salinarum NRC-1]MBB6090905.1 putative transport protein [Halobacterium salinarum]MDL0125574.1 hypothetical protein [Halobacterium salinarum]MDL0144713.1 hypothetical protein [Halobacterium salinarum]UEB93368.1 hypothetical protein LJ422_12025 [Halobacterium salinarum NRC-34001]
MAFIDTLVGSGVFVMFLAVVVGMAFGRINFGRGIKFGVAGPLFAGLVLGHFGFTVPDAYSGLTLALFVAAVGLIAAHEIEGTVKTYGLNFIAISVLMPTIAAILTYVWVVVVFPNASTGLIMGSFSGALTSSPGLGSAIEALPEAAAQQYQIGHSVGYVIGVLIIVMFQQLYPKLSGMNLDAEKQQFSEKVSDIAENANIEVVTFSVLGFALVLATGTVLGSIPIPLGPIGVITLGTTGGVLITALVLGYLGKIGPVTMRMETTILSEIRAFTLAMFLAVVGIDAGSGLVETIAEYGVEIVVTAGLNSIVAIIGGLVLTRVIWKMDWIHAAGGITGGHTDTKGLAAAIDATGADEVAAGYGNTYPFALLAMVIYAKILVAVIPL